MCPGKRKVIQGVGFKAKLFSSIKGKCVKNRKFVSVSVVAKKIIIESVKEKEEKVCDHQSPYKQLVSPFIDDLEVKKTLSNWRQMKVQGRQGQREAARLELEKVQNTACFYDNIDVMHDFHKLIGYSK